MKVKGFTLIELLVTLVVLATLSTIGIASYSYLIRKNEQQAIVDELRTVVQYAKIQALILGHPVYLSPLNASLGDWSHGMVLAALNNTSNKMDLLYQWQWNHPRWNLTWTGVHSSKKVTFSNNPVNAISNGHFTLTNIDSHQEVALVLNRLGRIRIGK